MARETGLNPGPLSSPARPGNMVAGGVLITLGGLALLGQLLPGVLAGPMFLPIFGLAFVAWGLLARVPGLLIPGGIIGGLGMGVAVLEAYKTQLPPPADGGVVLLGLAFGFASITVLTALVTRRPQWWAMIPATIIGLVATALVASVEVGPAFWLVGQAWPVFLIVLGVTLLLRRVRE